MISQQPRSSPDRMPDADETQRYTPEDPVREPEVPAGLEELSAWDEPPAASGVHILPIFPDDENATQSLVNEGLEEADRELRLESNTEDDEEPADTEGDYPRQGILS